MSSHCLICLDLLDQPEAQGHYHGICLSELFGTTRLPLIDADRASLPLALWKMAGGVSISGMQPKLSMRLSADRSVLETVEGGGEFILKPQSPKYMFLPENEHVTMRSALRAGIDIPPCGLVHLRDGSLAYIVRRYDRQIGNQTKLRQEDFCQLAQLPSEQKENGSAELCVRLVRKFVAVSPETEIAKLYRRLVFAYLTGNGDLHLKNLSLVIEPDGTPRLSPAYDQVCTCLVIPRDQQTLSICGKRDRLNQETFMQFARYAGLTPEAAGVILRELSQAVPSLHELVSASALPVDLKTAYSAILAGRAAALGRW